jgi:hypothetical protein
VLIVPAGGGSCSIKKKFQLGVDKKLNRITESIRVRRNLSSIVAFALAHNLYLCRPMTEEVTLRFAQGDKTITKKIEDV